MEAIQYTSQDVCDAFASAPNLNSALKSFLKREVRRGDHTEKFIKNFRKAALTGKEASLKLFFESHLPAYQQHVLLLAGYANGEAINTIAGDIIDRYADEFNATYVEKEKSIDITKPAEFERITKDVMVLISEGLIGKELPDSMFMKLVVINTIFEDKVIEKLLPMITAQ
jgi:hypothetical protein